MEGAGRQGVNWWTWRLVAHPLLPDGLADIRRAWSFADALEAHIALDALEEIRDIHAEPRT